MKLVRREYRLLNACSNLQILLNLPQRLAKTRIASSKRSLQGENTSPRMQPCSQLCLLNGLTEKVIRTGIKPQRQIARIFAGSEENKIDIVTKLAATYLAA